MTPEGIVVAAVKKYFSQPKFQRFSTETEYPIKIGSRDYRADVVLFEKPIDEDNLPLNAIAECKRLGVEGGGPDQLKSYLCATDTRFGIFANSMEPNDWKFYKNLGRNKFKEISCLKFERGVVNPIVRMLNFFRRSFRKLPEGSSGRGEDPPPDRDPDGSGEEPIDEQPPARYIGRDQPLQNESREDTVEPSLNGKPYYSEQNGFYWAANHQGIAECLPQHIKRIIHNEEVEIAVTRDELDEEINLLRQNIADLSEQKHECEQEIGQRTQEIAQKKEELAGLEVQSKTLTITEAEPLPIESTVDDSNPESFNASVVEGVPANPIIKRSEEEINDLIQEKADLRTDIDERSQALDSKKEELAGLEVELQGPTETELNPTAVDSSSHETQVVKHGFSWISRARAIISTIFFVFLAIYLFIFYASAVDKAFFLNIEAIQAQLAQGTYAGVNDVVNPSALFKAFQGEWNLVVIMFPFVFLAFAIALDYFHEQGKWGYLIALVLVVFTFAFDGILAIRISQKIREAKILMGQETEPWTFRIDDLNMWTVIFCGFVVSMLVSITYYVMNQQWKERANASDIRELQIRSEKTQRESRIAVLETEIENLESEINQLKEKEKATQQKITNTARAPIETQIAVSKTEMENLESEIEQLNNKDTAIQQEIDKTLAEIQELSRHGNKRVVNRDKMESQINQFLNGWCRFVAHSGDETSDVSTDIDRIKEVAKETLDYYYQGIPDYPD